MDRELLTADHERFRTHVRAFVAAEVLPHLPRWEDQGHIDLEFFPAASAAGLLANERALDGDIRYSVVVYEELVAGGATGVAMALGGFTDLVAPYLQRFATPEQRSRWWEPLRSGRRVAALAMTEPGTGSDLRGIQTVAERHGDHYVVTGTKTLIGSANLAGAILLVARTGSDALSLLVVDGDNPGVVRREPLRKLGLHAQQMGTLEFRDARVPAADLLGTEGEGMTYLRSNLRQERLTVAVMAVASIERLLQLALDHARTREAFGRPIGSFQATSFTLAELATLAQVARVFVDRCIRAFLDGRLSEEEAAMAKWWVTDVQQDVASRALQLHGGSGYLADSPVAREFLDARASTIYAGTNEIMKHIIGRHLLR